MTYTALRERTKLPPKRTGIYFAVYRHPDRDTANTLAVSQDRTNIIFLTRKDRFGRDLATVEKQPLHGVALVKVPMWMALDRKLRIAFPNDQLAERPWHKKDMRTFTPEEEREKHQYYEFADRAHEALARNGGTGPDTRRADSFFGAYNQ